MLKERINELRNLHLVADVLLTCLAYVSARAAAIASVHGPARAFGFGEQDIPNLIAICAIWGSLAYLEKGSYVYRARPIQAILKSVLRLVVLGGLLFGLWLFLMRNLSPGRALFAVFVVVDFTLLLGLRLAVLTLLNHFRRRGRNTQTILMVGTGGQSRRLVGEVESHPQWGVKLLGILDLDEPAAMKRYWDVPVMGGLARLPDILKSQQVDYVVFAVEHRNLSKSRTRLPFVRRWVRGYVCCSISPRHE